MKAKAMNAWKHLSRYTQGLILVMVSILFFAWGIFGQATVNDQTASILAGVRAELRESHLHLQETEETLLAQTNYFTCLLKIQPSDRTPKKVKRCERQSWHSP